MSSQIVETFVRTMPADDGHLVHRALRAERAAPPDLAGAVAGRFHPVFDVADDLPPRDMLPSRAPLERAAA